MTSLAIPPLGCGNGQLEWRAVGRLIYGYASKMDIPVELYAPYATPPRELTVDFLSQSATGFLPYDRTVARSAINPAWIALVEILRRIEEQPYHWPVGRTIFQKIAYIATREGLPTGFFYDKSSFGPFSADLKPAETKLVNSNLIQEERRGQWFIVKVGPNFERIRKDYKTVLDQWKPIIDKTTDLFLRMNTDQAEVVATVIFAADALQKEHNATPSEREVLDSVLQWKQRRKPPLDAPIVASAVRNLGMLRWLDLKPDLSFQTEHEELFEA